MGSHLRIRSYLLLCFISYLYISSSLKVDLRKNAAVNHGAVSVLSAKNKCVRLVLIAGRFKDVGNVNTVLLVVFDPRRYSY